MRTVRSIRYFRKKGLAFMRSISAADQRAPENTKNMTRPACANPAVTNHHAYRPAAHVRRLHDVGQVDEDVRRMMQDHRAAAIQRTASMNCEAALFIRPAASCCPGLMTMGPPGRQRRRRPGFRVSPSAPSVYKPRSLRVELVKMAADRWSPES